MKSLLLFAIPLVMLMIVPAVYGQEENPQELEKCILFVMEELVDSDDQENIQLWQLLCDDGFKTYGKYFHNMNEEELDESYEKILKNINE